MIREIIAAVLSALGVGSMLVSALGVLRLPDFFSRLHSSSIGETLGIVLLCAGLVIYHGVNFTSAKIVLIVIAMFIVNPVGTHLIGKAAIRTGKKPWKENDHADISD